VVRHSGLDLPFLLVSGGMGSEAAVAAMHAGAPDDQRIAARLSGEIRPGSIVVLHEGTAARHGVVAATDDLLMELGRHGLAAVTVSELVALGRGREGGGPDRSG
jgi:peptidoglycan/xylan/chitin deacetylase (PgdA/CDA1 family)